MEIAYAAELMTMEDLEYLEEERQAGASSSSQPRTSRVSGLKRDTGAKQQAEAHRRPEVGDFLRSQRTRLKELGNQYQRQKEEEGRQRQQLQDAER